MVRKIHWKHRLRFLLNRAMKYGKSLYELCSESKVAKKYLYKPKVHRLLCFYDYILPCFGNISLTQELVFEQAHLWGTQAKEKSLASHPSTITFVYRVQYSIWSLRIPYSDEFTRSMGLVEEEERGQMQCFSAT